MTPRSLSFSQLNFPWTLLQCLHTSTLAPFLVVQFSFDFHKLKLNVALQTYTTHINVWNTTTTRKRRGYIVEFLDNDTISAMQHNSKSHHSKLMKFIGRTLRSFEYFFFFYFVLHSTTNFFYFNISSIR